MKKLLLLTLGIAFALCVKSQTTVRMNTERMGFFTVTGDTMLIKKSDRVVAAGVYVPSYATDSVTINGCAITVDGISANGIKIPPGESTVSMGMKYAVLDSVTISCPNEVWLILLKDED